MSRRALGVVAVLTAALAGCSGAGDIDAPARSGELLVRTQGAAALAALPGGGLRFGELGGRVREVGRDGEVRDLARLRASRGGQRGLVGLAVDDRGRTFAAYTEASPPRRLVVVQVASGSARLVWRGPPSRDLANGGQIAFGPDRRLTIGIGDLQEPARIDDPDAVNGKLLSLDPDGPPDQRPRVLSGGWNNPYAFVWTADGALWVADNAPGERFERIGRGDPAGRGAPVLRLDERLAPAGLAALPSGDLLLCGFVSRRLDRVLIAPGRRPRLADDPLATDCSLGVEPLADGRIAYATRRAILVLPAPDSGAGR